jgi:hypothetical protein
MASDQQSQSNCAASTRLLTLCLIAAALAAFVPASLQFLRQGLPNAVFTGDGAALELGTLHASRGAQFVGPYSRFGWSHPGPMFFYLAAPLYAASGFKGPALNLFALVANAAVAVALVLAARQLRGPAFAFVVAALLAVYVLVSVPHLPTNEWNPVFPILPLALLSFTAVRLGLGHLAWLPPFVFVASLVVQTHIAFVPEVAAIAAVAVLGMRRLGLRPQIADSHRRRTLVLTAAVALLCWTLPLYEAATEQGGNLWRLLAFWEPKHMAQQSWTLACTSVFNGMAAMPLAIARALRLPDWPSGTPAVSMIAAGQLIALAAGFVAARRRRDDALTLLTAVVLAQIGAAVLAVRAIRGEVHDYLVIWTSVLGFLALAAIAASLVPLLQRAVRGPLATAAVIAASLLLIAAAIAEPVPRGPVFRASDPVAERLAREVEAYVRASHSQHPLVRIASRDTWPTAAGVVVHLWKRGIPVAVENDWLFMMGRPLAPRGREDLMFAFADREDARTGLELIAAAGGVYVYGASTRP